MKVRRPHRDPDADLPSIEVEVVLDDAHRHASGDLLSVAGLDVAYGNRRVVHDVTLRVEAGEVVVLIGHNGCGKSSTLRAVFGQSTPLAGDVVIGGVHTAGLPGTGRDHGVGFVPASGEVFADLSVRDNLVLAAGRHCPAEVLEERMQDALARFPGLRRRLTVHAGRLSGGEQRMVGIAIALMSEPRLLLLDEPTKHLAPALALQLLTDVRRLTRERHLGVLIAEVNVIAALEVADRVYVMRSGAIASEHTGTELLAAGPTAWWRMF